ncbi:LysM peptidoglycan-binding domain-containing protein [Paenalkalicoccus suaedae]|uniref:LysM peptidoglycan-binding domain-containing protein n=1 Tax=Paenalkalicoccus suaedae TaxID=2592382 RepID=A0A859FK70_9BACI|nr:CAP domain-containing protein [Paenalkalicoccus suaedae]QKS73194.1 LysM peptidoglycan-binding domain-containing protein [Paenalkalicoccus suaedae]
MLKKLLASVATIFVLSIFFAVAASAQTHTVERGETLWQISQKYNVSLQELVRNNQSLTNPNVIYPGQRITVSQPSGQAQAQTQPQTQDQNMSQFEQEVVRLTNIERQKQGLPALRANASLANVARVKSQDMRDRNYFSHQSPTYGSPFDMMRQFQISYQSAGENIAAGQTTPEQVVQGWMNSPGHRANIMSTSFNQIGIGYAQGGSYRHYWTQMFIRN